MKLFSYSLKFDDGAAPNPFGGLCTLVISKPALRRAAEVGDWIVGLGATGTPQGDKSKSVIYAMRVSSKMTLREYDAFCQAEHPEKIPQADATADRRAIVGDCIYDYSGGAQPVLRHSVHTEDNLELDLSGEFALISDHFYYFGDRAINLPKSLLPIVHKGPGHRSDANEPYAAGFVAWLEDLGFEPNVVFGQPQLWQTALEDADAWRILCAHQHAQVDADDLAAENKAK